MLDPHRFRPQASPSAMGRAFRWVFIVLGAGFLTACAHFPAAGGDSIKTAACRRFFAAMDRAVAEHGVADRGAAVIPGFPGLRVDRFLASFATERLSDPAYGAWVERLRRLDAAGRSVEWRNLPLAARERIEVPYGRGADAAISACGALLAGEVMRADSARERLPSLARVPDEYSTAQRVLGLYALTRWAAAPGVWRAQRELREPFFSPLGNRDLIGPTIVYWPAATERITPADVVGLLRVGSANPLGIPELSPGQLAHLFNAFAPVFSVETSAAADRIGMLRWAADGVPEVVPEQPVVYRLASFARLGERPLLQLNYIVWFPARSAEGWLNRYAGRLDGLIWRVTLGDDGRPIAYDSIHACGCFYQIFPGEGWRVIQPDDGAEPILSPMPIPRIEGDERREIRLDAGHHFIRGVRAVPAGPDGGAVYQWRDYDELRSLARPGGGNRSLFGPDGLVPGTGRAERFVLWPMGISSMGAMRQWGSHAISVLGRRHFDDPFLLARVLRPLREPN